MTPRPAYICAALLLACQPPVQAPRRSQGGSGHREAVQAQRAALVLSHCVPTTPAPHGNLAPPNHD